MLVRSLHYGLRQRPCGAFLRLQQRYFHKSHQQRLEQRDAFTKTQGSASGRRFIRYSIPISVGIACLAFMHYVYNGQSEERTTKGHPKVAVEGPWQVHFYALLPLRSISRLWGWLNDLTVPVSLRKPLYSAYAKFFDCKLDEMNDPNLTNYKNLATFFYRSLKPGVRPVDETALLVSPADGKVLHFGLITGERQVEQIKGVTYSLDALLGVQPESQKTTAEVSKNGELLQQARDTNAESVVSEKGFAEINSISYSLDRMLGDEPGQRIDGVAGRVASRPHALDKLKPGKSLFFAVIYLAPGDYHRFHSPTEWSVNRRRHFAGELFSVSPMAVNWIKNLFILNERVVLLGEWAHGFFSMIPVGATNVGAIRVDFDPELRTNQSWRHATHPPGQYDELLYLTAPKLRKGDEMGGFMLGSTVVLVFEAPTNFEFLLEPGRKVKMGETIGRLK
ncbi:phosphatidylserine decarboxylase-domain-containing protein [Gaertneriomyces semiglobifer]|nr:phosphatidylserine decarboxylase-domain-containing protein [Gaertneriomyces semiglobifer]